MLASRIEEARQLLEEPPAADGEEVEDWPAAEEGESMSDYQDRLHRPPR